MKYKGNNRDRDSTNSNSKSNPNKGQEESFLLNLVSESSKILKEKYKYNDEQIYEIFVKGKEEALLVPVSIFSTKLAPAEALIKYLKETQNINYHEISVLINRNERSIWASYQRAIKKMPSEFNVSDNILVPVSIFQNNKLSILECLISYLKDVKQMKNSNIAVLLNKNPNNIWTIYNRYNRKKAKEMKKQND